MTEVVAVVAMAVGNRNGDVRQARTRPGLERIRILARLAGSTMRRPLAAACERPAEARIPEDRDFVGLIHRAHQKTSRAFGSAAGNGSGVGSATLGSFAPVAPIRLFPTVEPIEAATLAQTM